MKRFFTWGWLIFFLSGCSPEFEERSSLITAPRLLAVRAEPAESMPGQSVTYRAIVASPDPSIPAEPIHWDFCAAPKPLTENNSVATSCLGNAVREIMPRDSTVNAKTPMDACQLFGPDTPPGDFRPRDPDDTGGFYQPLRVQTFERTAFVLHRVTCNLANAPVDVAVAFGQQYQANLNPKISSLRATVSGNQVDLAALPAKGEIRFELAWEADDAETYVYFDPATRTLVPRREVIRAFWYATNGSFYHDVTGRDEADPAHDTSNVWTAPETPGHVMVWVVLRDSRGGVDIGEYKVTLP